MKKLIPMIFSMLIFSLFTSLFVKQIFSFDEIESISRQINDLTNSLNMSKAATAPLESELTSLQKQVTNIKNKISLIDEDVKIKKKNIDDGYKSLAKQEKILYKTIQNFYIKSYYNSPLLFLLSSNSASNVTQNLAYQKAITDQDKAIITNIALSIEDLETKKKNLEEEQTRLNALKVSLSEQSEKLDKIVAGAKEYQTKLTSQIAQLSARQQQLLAEKLGSLNISRSAYSMGRCDSDLTNGRDPGFSPKFALFTYGVPNRTGLNQYGANGRAKDGQSAETILDTYYANFQLKKDYDSNISINVQGYGNFNIEDYVKRIYEIPESWEMEALKAQAVAARSYALAYVRENGSICTTEQCQVFKPDPKGGRWEEAVNSTKGWVMVQGDNPIKAWFSSTHGGYILSTSELPGWQSTSWTKHSKDTKTDSINSFDDLKNNAYDKDSPWFYCDWGSRPEYNKTAWLKPEEMADIINVLMLAKANSSTQKHLSQTDKPNPDGVDTWSAEKVKQELGAKAFNSISDISVSADFNSGRTTTVTVSGDGKSESFNGDEFKNYFNLRAPSNINIVGPLYNVEKR